MKRKGVILVVVMLVAIAALGAVYVTVLSPRLGQATMASANTPPPPTPIKLPEVTEEEKARAIDIALKDPRVQELLAGKSYVVAADRGNGPEIGLWHEGTRKLGVSFLIRFDEPHVIAYDWPSVELRDEAKTGFVTKTTNFAARAEGLIISVNLAIDAGDGAVAEIKPL